MLPCCVCHRGWQGFKRRRKCRAHTHTHIYIIQCMSGSFEEPVGSLISSRPTFSRPGSGVSRAPSSWCCYHGHAAATAALVPLVFRGSEPSVQPFQPLVGHSHHCYFLILGDCTCQAGLCPPMMLPAVPPHQFPAA